MNTIEDAVEFMQDYVEISKMWLQCKEALHTRYENLLLDYETEVNRIVQFLNLDHDTELINQIIDMYNPQGVKTEQRGMHLVKGKIGRYKVSLTPEQQALCLRVFQPYLEQMGYTH